MGKLLVQLLSVAVPVIAVLVAAAFVLPADFPWLQRQLVLAAIGIGGIALAEIVMFRTSLGNLASRLGFAAPNMRVVRVCLAVSLPMWLFLPIASVVTGTPPHVASTWPLIILGVVLVNGLAEEVIHRIFFFGRLREHTSFATAASLGALLFGTQHLYLIATLGPAAGLASVALALLLAYPLCHAFDMGGRSIAGPAILHTSSNASFLVFGDASNSSLLLLHMLVVLLSIYATLLVRRRRVSSDQARASPLLPMSGVTAP
jgi:membrane protease YdiL (CAAX protease family)